MPTHDYPYKNLVFEGGSVKGVAYGGVFEVLSKSKTIEYLDEPQPPLPPIKRLLRRA
jgi:hypothetical protein